MSDRLKGKRAVRHRRRRGHRPRLRNRICARRRHGVRHRHRRSQARRPQEEGIAEAARLDVRDTADVDAFAKRVGKTDILLNAAGFVHHGTILDCSDEDWDFSFDLNVKSMHRTIQAFLPAMLDRAEAAASSTSPRARRCRPRPTATSTARPRPRSRRSRARLRSTSSPRASAATASAPAPSRRPRCSIAPPPPAPTGARCSSRGRRWDGSAPPRKSPRSPSISPATKARSPPASTSSSMAAGHALTSTRAKVPA